jgi:hypothetical protein
LGKSSFAISSTSKATNSIPQFADFYLLLDNSPSMGVGATPTDIQNLINATANKPQDANCAFACHDLSGKSDWYTLAKNNKPPITMRIDVLRQATQNLMDTAQSTEVYANQFRMAIYTLGADASKAGLTSVQKLTSNLTTAKSSAGNVDLMTVPYQNYRGDTQTDLLGAMTQLNTDISSVGTGTAASPLTYVFFVSDGVNDRVFNLGTCAGWSGSSKDPNTSIVYPRCEEALDTSICTTMKKRGIKIAVLYTTYLPLPGNTWYNQTVAPWASSIAANMQSCASPGFYFEVTPSQGISDAMNALFKKLVAEAHLTQ